LLFFVISSLYENSSWITFIFVQEIVVGSNMDKIYMVMDYVEHDLKSLMQYSMKKPFLMCNVL
jgi:hypothetical protein